MVCDIAIMVDATCLVPRATHAPSASRNQQQLKSILRTLIVNVALDKFHEPVGCNLLHLEVFTHAPVPHVTWVHGSFITDVKLLITSVTLP